MGILRSLIRKESLHIVRDRRTMLITLLMPMVLLLLFGFAISTEVNCVRVAAVVDVHDDATRAIVGKLQANGYFEFLGLVAHDEVESMMRRGEADAVVIMRKSAGGVPETQIIVDSSNPTVGQASAAYIGGVLAGVAPSPVITRTLYNPQMKSAYNFVPGIMGMIFILICAIMTSVSIVSEKESGTLDLLLVSPVKPQTIIFGKLLPYFALSGIILAVMLLMAYTVLGLPLSATAAGVVALTLIYVVLSLSIGLLVSTVVSTRVSALTVSAVLFMMPVIMLSGMIFPIDNMPAVLQWISCGIPARWYIDALRKLMIQQLGLSHVVRETVILLAMTAGLLALAVRNFKVKR